MRIFKITVDNADESKRGFNEGEPHYKKTSIIWITPELSIKDFEDIKAIVQSEMEGVFTVQSVVELTDAQVLFAALSCEKIYQSSNIAKPVEDQTTTTSSSKSINIHVLVAEIKELLSEKKVKEQGHLQTC